MANDNDDHGQHHDDEAWPYRKEFLISRGSLEPLKDVFGDRLSEIQTFEQLRGRVDEPFNEADFRALTAGDNGEPLRLYDLGNDDVNDALDPMNVVKEAAAREIKASPILATTLSPHTNVMPGTKPKKVSNPPDLDPSIEASTPADIAVVDSGYNAESTPPWLADRVRVVDKAIDADLWDDSKDPTRRGWRGHGKFVASIIVQQNPNAIVWVAALKPLALNKFFQWRELSEEQKKNKTKFQLADEFTLYAAVRRLLGILKTPRGPGAYRALNLSAGAWLSEIKDEPRAGFLILAALEEWRNAQPEAPIIAAAGNHKPGENPGPEDLFIPGQLTLLQGHETLWPTLYGVKSLKKDKKTQSWFSNDADTCAIGEGLMGVLDDGTIAHWSGTSFATAVVSANVANGDPPLCPVPLKERLETKLGTPPPQPPPPPPEVVSEG